MARQPLVEAAPVVVAVEVADREREMANACAPSTMVRDAFGAGHPADLAHGKIARQVRDVAQQDYPGSRGDRLLEHVDEKREAWRRNREGHLTP